MQEVYLCAYRIDSLFELIEIRGQCRLQLCEIRKLRKRSREKIRIISNGCNLVDQGEARGPRSFLADGALGLRTMKAASLGRDFTVGPAQRLIIFANVNGHATGCLVIPHCAQI